MKHSQLRIQGSLRRVKDFTDTHSDVLGTISTSDAKHEVDAAIEAVTTHQAKQGSADRTMIGQMSRQRVLAKQLIESHMQPLGRFARGRLRGVPNYDDLTITVSTASPGRLLVAARTMAATAGKYEAELTRGGLAADTVERLTAATDAYADAIAQRAHARGLRVLSTTAIENALIRGRDAVKVLDAQITQQLPAGDALLAAWRSISRVEAKGGKVRAVNAPAAVEPDRAEVRATAEA